MSSILRGQNANVQITCVFCSRSLAARCHVDSERVGTTGMPQADGSQKAIEVHIFPEAMRGTGEGHYPWDLRPQSTMTNANVEQTATGVDGQTLTLKYKDGEKKILVPPDAMIVTYVPGDKSEITPGTKIFIAAAKKLDDGTFQTPRINYGKNGLGPPM